MKRTTLLVAAALLASCRSKNHEDALDPVQAFVREAKSGGSNLPTYRAVCDDLVDDGTVVAWSESLRRAVTDHGRDVRYDVVSKGDREAQVRLTFPSGAVATVRVRERWSGWWITAMDLETMTAAPPQRSAPFSAGGGDADMGGG